MLKNLTKLSFLLLPILFYYLYSDYLTLHSLNQHRHFFSSFAEENPISSGLIYVAVVTFVIGLTVPGATTLSFASGVIFPQPQAAILAYLGFVLGACLSYTMVRTLLFDYANKWLRKVATYNQLAKKLKENGFWYLVFARYTLVFPFWLVNGACALVEVPFQVFFSATALAVIPGSFIYTTAGRALSRLLDKLDVESVNKISTWDILSQAWVETPELKICLGLLAVAVAVPLGIKKFVLSRRKKSL
jgi:uncharacterized membrane protein YdjX (TVP38/TMEM64 family)